MKLLPKKKLPMRRLQRLKDTLARFSAQELESFDLYLHQLIEAAWRRELAKEESREEAQRERRRAVIYRQELVRCGKEHCRCAQGHLHGPYWYAYYRSPRSGRVVSKYLGKKKREIRIR